MSSVPNPPGFSAPASSRSTGRSIPRLQELSFLEVAILGVADGAGFEETRRRMVSHMIELRESNPGTGNIATYRLAQEDPKRYVQNVTEALKELMRLELVVQATLPSSARAARSYNSTTFALTQHGERWSALLRSDIRAAYDELLAMLWQLHPQFAGFVRAIAIERDRLVIPLAAWGELPFPRTRERYVEFLATRVAEELTQPQAEWTATSAEIHSAITAYLEEIRAGAAERGRPDPHKRNQDFVRTCEKALVKYAFGRYGIILDYISQEILRRWTKVLGVVNFSYHVPGRPGLRYWSTATLDIVDDTLIARRRTGREHSERVAAYLKNAYDLVRREDTSPSLWVPIYRVRAAACSQLLIPDAVFDRALIGMLEGATEPLPPFRVNIDPAQYGTLPPTELPLRVQTSHGLRNYYSMSLIPKTKKE